MANRGPERKSVEEQLAADLSRMRAAIEARAAAEGISWEAYAELINKGERPAIPAGEWSRPRKYISGRAAGSCYAGMWRRSRRPGS